MRRRNAGIGQPADAGGDTGNDAEWYLGGDKGWVRAELIPTAVGNPVPRAGEGGPGRRGEGAAGVPPDPNAPPRVNNGISGDARRSTAALGKMAIDIKVDYAVKQIQGFLANQKTTQQ